MARTKATDCRELDSIRETRSGVSFAYSVYFAVQHAVDLTQPGDTVFVLAGKYAARVKASISGQEGHPITLRAMPRGSVIVSGFDLEASYIHIEGFEITADKPAVAVQLNGSRCEVLDNYIHDMKAGVAGTVGKLSPDGKTRDYSAVAHNRIAYNKVYHSEYGFVLGKLTGH